MRHYGTTICVAALLGAASLTAPALAGETQVTGRVAIALPAQSLGDAVMQVARRTGVEIVFAPVLVQGRQAPAINGTYTAEEAIGRLLAGSGLTVRRAPGGALVIQDPRSGEASSLVPIELIDEAVLPEILVMGDRNWSLNTGIRRTENDSQPFIVATREEIERSGTPNLESFLRDFITTNATVRNSDQAGTSNQGRSVIDLRGLGARETLVLVDGRRQPGVNTGNGEINQPSVTNIPLAAIERIEVLSSSASGLYGLGATGGVVNIILRRDYNGAELSATYADTSDFAAADSRIDFTYGRNLEGGRTNLSLTASWRDTQPLLLGDREFLRRDNLERALRNDPRFVTLPPVGTTPNIRSQNNQPLRLDPAFGGTLLGSSFTSVPQGFRGVALDGIAPLLANIGVYNTEAPDLATPGGLRAPLVFGSTQFSATAAVRREVTPWLKMYLEGAVSETESVSIQTEPGLRQINLPANAPNNPFQSAILVVIPAYGPDVTQELTSTSRQYRGVAGAIATLPYDWQAAADFSWSRAEFDTPRTSRQVDPVTTALLTNGGFNIIQDLALNPIPFKFSEAVFPDTFRPSDVVTASLKLAGPVPLTLPAGRPSVSLNLERTEDDLPQSFFFSNDLSVSRIVFTPERSQTIDSVYLEMRVPLVSPEQKIPFIEELELQFAARHERYKGVGADSGYECYFANGPFPAGSISTDLCDVAVIGSDRTEIENSHTDPSVSLKWRASQDVTVRASFATGYLTPRLGQLVREPTSSLLVQARDPARGGEFVGQLIPGTDIGIVPGFLGGNPDLDIESSKTQTIGIILTPRFLPGFRFSADWSVVEKEGNVFAPNGLLFTSFSAAGQAGFETFLNAYPDRFVRGPASGGFAVGPITSIDASLINFTGSRAEAIDFSADYARDFLGGQIAFDLAATHVLDNSVLPFPGLPEVDYTGVILGNFTGTGFVQGSLDWKGNASVRWSGDRFDIGVRARYLSRYDITLDGSAPLAQGAASVASQTYWDLFGSYQLREDVELRAGVNNVFSKSPPFDSSNSVYYSAFGDPRLANFYLTVRKSF